MKKTLLTTAAATVAVPLAQGAITFHDLGDQTITPGVSLYIDMDSGTSSGSSFAGYDFYIFFENNETLDIFDVSDWKSARTGAYTTRLSYGDSLAFSYFGNAGYLENADTGYWQGDTGTETAYIAAQNISDLRKAWIGVRYDDENHSLVVESFAVGSDSDTLTAGMGAPVPEPAETAAVMALLAGGAAAFHRRRKLKTSA